MDYTVHGSFPDQNTGVGSLSLPSPRHFPNPEIEPRSPALQADSLPAEPPGKPPIHHLTLTAMSAPTGTFLKDPERSVRVCGSIVVTDTCKHPLR